MNLPANTATLPPGGGAPTAVQAGWWRRLFHDSEEAQFICRMDGTVAEFNRRAAEWFKLDASRPDATGALQQALAPAVLTRLFDFLSQDAAAPALISSITLRAGQQHGLIADLHLTPLGGGSALLTIKDATRRWRMESQMQLLLAAVNATPDVVMLVDTEAKLLYVNPAFQTVTGYTPEQALGRTTDFLRAPAERPRIDECLAQVGAGRSWQGEFANVRPDGRSYSVAAVISPIFDSSGARLGFVSFERDAGTDRAQLEELRGQLSEARRHEALAGLLCGVAHGFENLLYLIRGYTGMALGSMQLPAELRPPLTQVDEAAGRASEIARKLLDHARAQRSAGAEMDLNQTVARAVEGCETLVRADIQLRVEPAAAPVPVRLDAAGMQRILQPLLLNAQEAMPQGGQINLNLAVVALGAEQAARTGKPAGAQFVRCRVADGGGGIAGEILPRIFDPFFTTKPDHQGLGLATVHSLTALADGFVEVASRPGEGSTFDVYLPLVVPAVSAAPVVAAPVAPAAPPPPCKHRVLVVDDVDLVLEFTCSLLQDAGYEIFSAPDAEEAMKVLEGLPAPVDLILTDFNLGSGTGVDLMNAATARWPHIQCIISSGYFEERDKKLIEQRGARILEKPFKIELAVSTIRELLGEPPAG